MTVSLFPFFPMNCVPKGTLQNVTAPARPIERYGDMPELTWHRNEINGVQSGQKIGEDTR